MRVLQVVKTADGAAWAARQASILHGLGVEIHVAIPAASGRAVPAWEDAGAEIHVADLRLPVRSPGAIASVLEAARVLVARVQPDIIHSHFVTTTCTLRIALGRNHRTPRVFQVAGPLHLEHWHSRRFELALAGGADHWIASSGAILERYRLAGVPAERTHLSYHGWFERGESPPTRSGTLRAAVGASAEDVIVGNVNYMYPPKRYLGQRVGLKCHEDVIDAIAEVLRARADVLGVLVGGVWGDARWYEQQLRRRARERAGERIHFTGRLPPDEARRVWSDFDLGVHVPLSENCGGVVEPLFAAVPVIAGDVGGLPEVVMDGRTGYLVPIRQPRVLAQRILAVLAEMPKARELARRGQQLVRSMFDAQRTGMEVLEIYQYLLRRRATKPPSFVPVRFVEGLGGDRAGAVA